MPETWQQDVWTRGEQVMDRKISQSELWMAKPFWIKLAYNVFPSPTNFFSWCVVETPACSLCQRQGYLEHILSCCLKALEEGLQLLVPWSGVKGNSRCTGIIHSKQWPSPRQIIAFVREGKKKPQLQPNEPGTFLARTWDWQLKVNLGRELKFPDTITVTKHKPNARAKWRPQCEPIKVSWQMLWGPVFPDLRSSFYRFAQHESNQEQYRQGFEMAVDQAGWSMEQASYLDTRQRLVTPGWVTWARVSNVERPEYPHLWGHVQVASKGVW